LRHSHTSPSHRGRDGLSLPASARARVATRGALAPARAARAARPRTRFPRFRAPSPRVRRAETHRRPRAKTKSEDEDGSEAPSRATMSFILRRQASQPIRGMASPASMTAAGVPADNARTRLPSPESGVFREGYVHLRSTGLLGGAARGSFLQQLANLTFSRSFCILFAGELSFHDSWSTLRDDVAPRERLALTSNSRVEDTSAAYKRALCLTVTRDLQADHLEEITFTCETEEDHRAWFIAVTLEVRRQRGGADYLEFPPVRARFFEGYLFKTPPEADRWEERFFELSGDGELSYWASFGSGRKGSVPLDLCKVVPNQTEAAGSPTPFVFQVHTFLVQPDGSYVRRIFNLCAPGQSDYLAWLKALRLWIGVARPKLPDVEGAPHGRPITESSATDEAAGAAGDGFAPAHMVAAASARGSALSPVVAPEA